MRAHYYGFGRDRAGLVAGPLARVRCICIGLNSIAIDVSFFIRFAGIHTPQSVTVREVTVWDRMFSV